MVKESLSNRLLLAYLAGIIDGEGHVGIHREQRKSLGDYYQPQIRVEMTTEAIPQLLYFTFGGNLSTRQPSNPKYHRVWAWQLVGAGACDAIRRLYPYLILKKSQADIILRLQADKPPKGKWSKPFDRLLQEADYVHIKALNVRGVQN